MTDKSTNFRVRLDPELHEQFLAISKRQDIPVSQVISPLMRSHIEQNPINSEALKPYKNHKNL